ncbi:DUF7669 domain-containing protein [Deinococcus daejeonensis]|uniref:DUF7669 domain-containing protein n=1 Tax=Deinococcus daejeonensis TaxID=1007098 RepID=A0ABQ2IY50_9DEIO|nr:hypothetical protein [Deinococcus daejeonensis]GGN32348.1 hypothetical protein GCM10010842_08970 [Deinococcus daejeonensis]
MTCREEILAAARVLSRQHTEGTFSMQDIVAALREKRTQYLDITIRRLVSTQMCVNAVGPDAGKYKDLERVRRGRYRLLK